MVKGEDRTDSGYCPYAASSMNAQPVEWMVAYDEKVVKSS
jgi:hypothetical protein